MKGIKNTFMRRTVNLNPEHVEYVIKYKILKMFNTCSCESYVYWTVHHCDS